MLSTSSQLNTVLLSITRLAYINFRVFNSEILVNRSVNKIKIDFADIVKFAKFFEPPSLISRFWLHSDWWNI